MVSSRPVDTTDDEGSGFGVDLELWKELLHNFGEQVTVDDVVAREVGFVKISKDETGMGALKPKVHPTNDVRHRVALKADRLQAVNPLDGRQNPSVAGPQIHEPRPRLDGGLCQDMLNTP